MLDKCEICAKINHVPYAGIAHPVERHLAKVEVASSSLVARSRKKTTAKAVVFFSGAKYNNKSRFQTKPAFYTQFFSLCLSSITEVMIAVMGTERITPILLAIPLMTSSER